MEKYVIIDLEMCHVPKDMRTEQYHWALETIQIGAVLVDEKLHIVDEFCTYVKPQYGAIDAFIENFTGITTNDVKDACNMEEALRSFVDWVPEDAVCVSWSNSDEYQIQHEIEAKGIYIAKLDRMLETWQDCQKTFSEKISSDRSYNLEEALIVSNIVYDENIHNGLVDAKNTALLFVKMMKEPVLILNEYFMRRKEEVRRETFTLGEVFHTLGFSFA